MPNQYAAKLEMPWT